MFLIEQVIQVNTTTTIFTVIKMLPQEASAMENYDKIMDNYDPVRVLQEFNISLAKSINGEESDPGKPFGDEHLAYAITLVGLAVCHTFQTFSDMVVDNINRNRTT